MTLKDKTIRNRSVYVSNAVYQDYLTLALCHISEGSEDVMTVTPDQLIDETLREVLDGMPAVAERRRAMRKAIETISKEHPLK